MALTYSDVSNIINNQIMKNATGDNSGTVIAEDLSNLVDVLKVVNANNEIDLRNSVKSLLVGIHNYVIDRVIETKQFKMLRDAVSYGGGIQRIMQTGLFTAQESHILNLAYGDGVTPYSYHDGKFYGSDASATLIDKTETWKVAHSVADTFYSTWFNNAEDLVKWSNSIANKEQNTIRMMIANLEQRVINMAIVQSATATTPRVVKLLSMFNDLQGRTTEPTTDTPATPVNSVKWTMAELRKYRDEFAYFSSYCKSLVARLVDYTKRPNKKYNDGSILTWVPTEKIGCILNTQFATEIDYIGNPVEFKSKDFTVDFETIDTWQNLGGGMLPDYASTTTITMDNGTSDDIVVNNVVGFIYDSDGLGCVNKLQKVTVENVGAEGFENYFNHNAMSYYVDPRLSSVALILE